MHAGRTRMYRVSAVATLMDVSPSTVYRAIETGALAALRIGTSLRVPHEAFTAWQNLCKQAATTTTTTTTAATTTASGAGR